VVGSCDHSNEPTDSINILGISLQGEKLQAPQEGTCIMEKDIYFVIHLNYQRYTVLNAK
jgi:hypothetical protein